MKFNKVIYIRYMPLTKKIYSDFYMKEAETAGLEVEYWDITNLFFRKNHGMEVSSELVNTRLFNTYSELEGTIKVEADLSKVLFISIMTFEGRVTKLYKLFTKYDCILGVFGRNMFPIAHNQKYFKQVFNKLKLSTISNYLKQRRLVRLMKEGKIKRYDVAFIGGSLGWQGIGKISLEDLDCTEKVKVNSDDYDQYLLLKNEKSKGSEPYILFLDEYLPLHPDAILFNIKNVKAEDYYPDLNKYFGLLESKMGLPVIIAAHPKALRYKNEDFFEGRKVVFNQTAKLAKDAFFVLAHDSTSINYPIAFGKKIHFITSKNIKNGIIRVHRNVIHFSKFLGCNYQYMDQLDEEINLIDEIPVKDYENYKYSFQTSVETENQLTSEIFVKYLIKGL